VKVLKTSPKQVYLALLALWAIGSFGLFAGNDLNPLLQTYGLALFLQAGFALVYLHYRRQQQRDRQRRSRDELIP